MKAKITTPSYILLACLGLFSVLGHAFAEGFTAILCLIRFSEKKPELLCRLSIEHKCIFAHVISPKAAEELLTGQ